MAAQIVINPPDGEELAYIVVYQIELTADNPLEAAREAQNIMRHPIYGEYLEVIDNNGNITTIDLNDEILENKD